MRWENSIPLVHQIARCHWRSVLYLWVCGFATVGQILYVAAVGCAISKLRSATNLCRGNDCDKACHWFETVHFVTWHEQQTGILIQPRLERMGINVQLKNDNFKLLFAKLCANTNLQTQIVLLTVSRCRWQKNTEKPKIVHIVAAQTIG